MLASFLRRQEQKWQHERIRMRNMVTILDGFGITLLNNMFRTEGEVQHLQDVFPDLFKEESENVLPEPGKLSAEMEVYKAARLHQAYCFNRSRQDRG